MGKRHVFWRKPTGQPYKKDDGKFTPASLLAKIGELATLDTNKCISWRSPDLQQNELAVRSAIVVLDPDGYELNELDTWSTVSKAIDTVIIKKGGGKPILEKDFISSADKAAAEYFRQQVVYYILVSSLSVRQLPFKKIRVRNCEISALAKSNKYVLPKALAVGRSDDRFTKHSESTKYLKIRVRTFGRSVFAATDKALEAINLLRGLWTLFSTYGEWAMRMGSAKQEPIGVIHTGPVHTLHQLDGSPATELFWYEPIYTSDKKMFTPNLSWSALDESRRGAARLLKRHPFGTEVENLIIRYAESLDQPNLDLAFVHMWSILERITDTIGASYDETIHRASWVFEDQKSTRENLGYLRMRRNQYIHSSKTSEDRDQAAYLVKSFIDPHLMHLINNDFEVDSIAEYGKFLALPTNINTLEKRRDQINRAIRLRK